MKEQARAGMAVRAGELPHTYLLGTEGGYFLTCIRVAALSFPATHRVQR
jgi:hypothetical protein